MTSAVQPLRLVVLISGAGSNLQALIDSVHQGADAARIVAVISNRAEAHGLERARRAGIATQVVNHSVFADRAAFDAALLDSVETHQPDLVILAGFMRILTPLFVRRYQGRLLNIHPSLLPKYPGLNTHARALDAGDTEHGASVHFVTEALDGGPVVAQIKIPIRPDDDAASLAARLLPEEHRLYPTVVRWFCAGRLRCQGDKVWLDDALLPSGGLLLARD